MSAISRLSRSKSKSPQRSPTSSPKRKPLHERSHSETNSIAGSASTGPPLVRDDSDPVYSASPFPRLPSQILAPKGGSPFIFEDDTSTIASKENAGIPYIPSRGSSRRKRTSPPGSFKARRSPRHSPRSSLETGKSRTGSAVGRHGRGGSRDMTRPLDDVLPPAPARTSSRVRSMISAIEASSVRSQSPPPTPRLTRNRSRGSRASIVSRRYEIGSRDAEALVEENAPSLSQPVIPLSLSGEGPSQTGSSARQIVGLDAPDMSEKMPERSTQQFEPSVEHRIVSEQAQPLPSSSSQPDPRPRSSSAPGSPTETLLAALIASGALHYPRLERPSVNTLRTDSSSLRQAVPQPLQLRRQPARSNLALANSPSAATTAAVAGPSNYYYEDDLGDNRLSIATSYDAAASRPETPQQQIVVHPPSSARWTPGRWEAEMEDRVPEMQPRLLRAQKSYRESWHSSQTDLMRSESVTSFQSTSSTSLPFYHFLNDSKTAWARSYYRGEGALRLMTPPSVTMIRTLSAKSAVSAISAMTPPSRHSRSASDSGPDRTPDSVSYPQDVFIPRIRPFRYQSREPQRRLPPVPAPPVNEPDYRDYGVDDHVPAPVIVEQSDVRPLPPAPLNPGGRSWQTSSDTPGGRRYHRVQAEQPSQLPPRDLIPAPFDPTAHAPHLSPDRGNDDRISVWRPPSIEPQSIFGTVNRQISLFCLGFCFPFGESLSYRIYWSLNLLTVFSLDARRLPRVA